jgi:octaprenyl-diphosphate synthase
MAMVLSEIRTEAQIIDSYMRQDLEAIQAEVDKFLYEVLDYGLLGGGKRIRPLLVVLAAKLCGSQEEDAYRLGCAFEYLHAATLFHDDIIDNALLRRGRASVFQKYGLGAAILAGDFLHALAMSTVGRIAGSRGLEIFCEATRGMVDGEFMQIRNAKRHSLAEADYYTMIMGKTGLLIRAACEIGALFGGGTDAEVQAMRRYGTHLGYAFQIIDDLLDFLGNPTISGKNVGTDLLEGKITLPLLLAMQSAGPGQQQKIVELITAFQKEQTGIQDVCDLINRYDGFSRARQKAEEAAAKALTALLIFDDEQVARERRILSGLVKYVLARQK